MGPCDARFFWGYSVWGPGAARVTHSIAQARRVSDRIAFFYLGRLVEEGVTAEVLERPSEEQTRAYLAGHFG